MGWLSQVVLVSWNGDLKVLFIVCPLSVETAPYWNTNMHKVTQSHDIYLKLAVILGKAKAELCWAVSWASPTTSWSGDLCLLSPYSPLAWKNPLYLGWNKFEPQLNTLIEKIPFLCKISGKCSHFYNFIALLQTRGGFSSSLLSSFMNLNCVVLSFLRKGWGC